MAHENKEIDKGKKYYEIAKGVYGFW